MVRLYLEINLIILSLYYSLYCRVKKSSNLNSKFAVVHVKKKHQSNYLYLIK